MGKSESYSCSELLNYLENRYDYDTERKNYAQYLLKMQDAPNIEKIIHIYNKVLWKLIVLDRNGRILDEFTNRWNYINLITDRTKKYCFLLNAFLNESIEKLFYSQRYSDKLAYKCLTNLRKAENYSVIQSCIFAKSSDVVNASKNEILYSLEVLNTTPNTISSYKFNTNGYVKCKDIYIENIKYLVKLGYIKDLRDSLFEEHSKITYIADNKKFILKTCLIIACIVALFFVIFFLIKYAITALFGIAFLLFLVIGYFKH